MRGVVARREIDLQEQQNFLNNEVGNNEELKKELDLDVHKITISELCQRLGTNLETGLTEAQAKANLEREQQRI